MKGLNFIDDCSEVICRPADGSGKRA